MNKQVKCCFVLMSLAIGIKAHGEGAAAYVLPIEKRAQSQLVASGRVVNASDGKSLSGVSISVKNGTATVVTDANGQFSITLPNNRSVLVLSSVGFRSAEFPLTGQATGLVISLTPAQQELDLVEISVPYGTETRASITGSAVVVKGAALADRPRSSFQNSLQGNVPGLQVTESTGQPGAAPTVRLRGITSFQGAVTPLYVIDGVPMLTQGVAGLAFSTNSAAGLNPNDIADITVLKDGSASAIYGSQGANGVILITTKSGQAGKTQFKFSANYGQNRMSLSERGRPLNTEEMTELLIEGVINSNLNATVGAITTPEAAYSYLIGRGLNPDVNTDWFDVITQVGQYQQYNLSASGGNDKTKYFVSGGYYTQDAVTKGQGFDRKTGRINLTHQATDKLSFGTRLTLTNQNLSTISGAGTGQNPVRSLYRFVPWLAVYDDQGNYNPLVTYNPEMLRNENKYETKIYQAIGNVNAAYAFTDYLSFESRAGIDFHYSDDYRYWSPNWADGRGSNGRGMEYNRVWNNWTFYNVLKFNNNFGDFGVNAILGQEAAQRNLKSVSTQANNFVAEDLYTLANTSEPYIAWSSKSHASIASYFLNTSFNYQEKYYVNLTGRRDGSSRFGRDVRYGNFWSVGGSWNMHREAYMENLDFIQQLKLRVSYSRSGNQLGDYYGSHGYYSTNQNYMNQPGIAIGQIENGTLRWEKNHPLNVGLEFSLFSSRLSGSVDWYDRLTTDLIQDMPVSHTNGVTNLTSNSGKMKNYGFEIALSSQNIVSNNPGGFEWTTDFNITTQKNKILDITDGRRIESYFVREIGGDYYNYYLRGYAGVDPATGEALWWRNGDKAETTKVYTEAAPFEQNRSALSDFFGGLTNTFSYKGVSLSALIYFNWGNSVYDTWGTYTHNDGSAQVGEAALMSRMIYNHRWQQPGDNAIYPKVVFGGTQTGLTGQHSTRFLYDGSYVRLRDVTLAYSIPTHKMGLRNIGSASLFLRANNLYTYTKDKLLPYDPEVGVTGLFDQNLPISKQFVLGLDITF